MNKAEEGVTVLIAVIVVIYIICLATFWANMSSLGPSVPQGTSIVILSNTTIFKDGQICQSVEKANVAYTGENSPNWWRMRAVTMLFPTVDFYVVKSDGTQLWVNYKYIETYDPAKSYCSPVAQ